jgi:DNA polymerase-3 subunit alpha
MSDLIFSHLHVHTEYSLLCGVAPLAKLYKESVPKQIKAVAMTDRGNMFGTVDFYKKFNAKDSAVKGIIGCEVYFVSNIKDKDYHHLVLLAENESGYESLKRIVSKAYLDHRYVNDIPRVDLELLKENKEGVIVLSGGVRGIIERAIYQGKKEEASKWALIFHELFGQDHFYLEVQSISSARHQKINQFFRELNLNHKISLCATNECFYLKAQDGQSLSVLSCISQGLTLDTFHDEYAECNEYYFKSAQEVHDILGTDFLDAIQNTNAIADRCQLKITLGKIFLPTYQVPDGYNLDSFLTHRSHEGLKERFEEFKLINKEYNEQLYKDRLDMELGVIIRMQFPGYFLIVQDFINWAKQNDIPVGPGRGSGAGSLVAYVLRITDFDPIPYGLLFERFLNPERVSMPDFDVDFCMDRRTEVIGYVTQKYGQLNVGQIATFGALKAKGVIRDVGRVLGMPVYETDAISKLIPDNAETLEAAMNEEPRLKNMSLEPKNEQLFDIAQKLEGLNRNVGMHAAGVVIGDLPLWHYCPVFKGGNGELVTQFAKDEVEQAGLVKFDFLGLKTLTVIQHAVKMINRKKANHEKLDINTLALTDRPTYDLISSGETESVFQLESTGFQGLLKKLKPDVFEDIIAAVALYRPGPLNSGMLDSFINRKHGREPIVYDHPLLEQVLKETYGVIVYQEQVMQIAQILAHFSLGGADLLRRAMGKKKPEEMAKQRVVFNEGAAKNGIPESLATSIFDVMEKFAEYGFNKSHSAAYALLTYQTAYLKQHYPAEFMASVLTNDRDNPEKVSKGVRNALNMGLRVLPPSINESDLAFDVRKGEILFGLNGIKGVGEAAVDAILEARKEGKFTSFSDFFNRVDLRRVNKKVVETLIQAGAFDCFGQPRQRLSKAIEKFLLLGQQKQKDQASGQGNLLDMFGGDAQDSKGKNKNTAEDEFKEFSSIQEWSKKELLQNEKNTLGFYVSGHPLDHFDSFTGLVNCQNLKNLSRFEHNEEIILVGMISELRTFKKEKTIGFIKIEDKYDTIEAMVSEDVLNQYYKEMGSKDPLVIVARVSIPRDAEKDTILKLQIENHNQRPTLMGLVDYVASKTKAIEINIEEDAKSLHNLPQFEQLIKHKDLEGKCPLYMNILTKEKTILCFKSSLTIQLKENLEYQVKQIFPSARVRLLDKIP